MKFSRTLLALFVACSAFANEVSAQSILYGATGGPSNPGSLYTINPATGFATLVGPLVDIDQAHYAITGLALANGVLYGSTSLNSPTAPGELVTINPANGQVTTVGAFGIATMGDLTFDSVDSTLYGTFTANGNLYSINTATGAATVVGPSGIAFTPVGVGLAANAGGTLFGAPGAASGSLYTYNPVTGAATPVATLSNAPFGGAGGINALAFNSSGTLFGVDVNRNDSTTPRASDLITIDTVTGAVTDIGAIADISGNIPFVDAVVFDVPEPSTWLGATLSSGILLFSLFRRLPPRHNRRR